MDNRIYKLIIIVIFNAALIALILFLFSNIKKNSSLIVEEKQNTMILAEKQKITQDLEIQFTEFKNNIKKLETGFFIPEGENLLDFINLIESVSKKTGVSVEIEAGHDTIKNSPKQNFTLNIQGEKDNTFKFLMALENLPYFLNIEQMQIQFPKTPTLTVDKNAKKSKTPVDKNLKTYLNFIIYTQ